MNYSGNMPDWHQYNPSQSGINDVTSTAQNVNSGHLSFISSINPTCPTQLNSLNLSSEGFEKHQSDPNFNPRHFQPHLSSNISHGHNAAADNTPLASMVQMQNCIGHYGPSNTRNPMVDNPMDPRNAPIGGLNEELGYRNNQVPLNGPISHMNGPNVMNMNAPPHGSIGPRNHTNVNSHATSRTAGPPPSYVPCKALCCNPDPNINYQQWEKYCSYQNNATYRENIRSSGGYQADARRFNSDFNFRKDNFDGKEVLPPVVPPPNGPNADHRRNFPDYKYRKDRMLSRNYPPSGMLQNYPMQSYNYTGEYQKYPYNVKEYSKMSGMNVPNQGMVKHQEQGFAIPQQKYNSKQVPYQNNSGTMMPSSMPSATNVPNPSMISSAQNTYFNSQYSRNLPTENTHDCQETTTDNVSMVNRMQASAMHAPPHSRYQIYQQKIAMQRFSTENHLRELMRIPGYQSHPKYKEYAHRFREILKLQQSITYQGSLQQTPPCVTASTVANTSAIPPINLQFDQNGVLINSNYMSEAFSRIQQVPPVNPQAPLGDSSADKQVGKDGNSVSEMANHNIQKPERLMSQQHNNGGLAAAVLCSENVQKQDGYPMQKSLDQSQFEVQKTGSENFNNLDTNTNNTAVQQKISKEFADKPELDVRQFLANWDESEDEDGASSNLPILTDSTPVVVVGYENVNLSAKTLEDLNGSKSEEITSNVITFENQDKSNNIDVMPAQDCLTISYSAAENIEIAKDSTCKEIISKENIVPGSHIIQCISNGPDEVPTIHIVDNLEIGSILQVANGQTVAETVALERQEAVSFFQEGTAITASAMTLEVDKKTDNESASTEYNAEALETLSKDIVEGCSPPKTMEDTSQTSRINAPEVASTLPTSMKDNLDAAQDMNLKKQNSFASEESHNPDDISLPDLPTSECTPISTTLNTPIHSDNEESSESHVDDLTISTNPIEIIQNSPMISFTQSPTNREPYDHLSDQRNKSIDPPEGEYRAENHFKNDGSTNNMLGHNSVLGTFEFSTNINKNDATIAAKNSEERVNTSENSKNNNEKVFSLHDETENVEATGMHMTLTSASEYELKIVSTGMQQNKSMRDYKNSTITERRANESQATSSTNPDAHKQLQILPETNVKATLRYANSMELNNIALQNITSDPDPVELNSSQDINYSEKKCISTCQTITTSTISLSTNDITLGNSRSTVEDGCSTKIIKSDSMSRSTKHSTLSNNKSRKCETFTSDKFAKEDLLEKNANANKVVNLDAKNSKNSRHITLTDHKKSISDNQTISRKKKCLSENTADKLYGETIIHHNKHTQEAATLKENKSYPVENLKKSDISHNKPRVIDNVSIDDSGERMRLLKEYRRMKYKSPTVGLQNKNKGMQEDFDCTVNKKPHSSPEEMLQLPSNKQLYQKDVAKLKSSDEQEKKRASILKTFVSKNINPDFAIQVTNVNLKLKDNNHQKESQNLEEKVKNSGPLDAIKIEINVSCTERNTSEKLLHENIKNAVAETIGHLTNSISNGVRSNSTSITEIQCDKKTVCDKAADCRDYEGRARSPAALTETSIYTEAHENPTNTEVVKHDTVNSGCKEDLINETSGSFKKRRSSLLEGESINDIYKNKDNVDTEAKSESSALEISKSEQAAIRRRSLHEESDKKVAAINICSEELKISSDNLSCARSTSKNIQKKEHQETTAVSLCRNAKSFQDDIASRLNAIPSTSSSTVDPNLENASYDNPVHFDYNHFDVAPNENADASTKRIDKWKKSKRDDGRFGNFDLYETASGYVNPTFFSADEPENLNTVPVYTTKDGKITYSPNPRFTYRELIMEARVNESYNNTRESYFTRSPSYDYYNCSKLRKVFKRNRDVASITDKKEELLPADTKSAVRHIDHLPNKNAVHKSSLCAKTSRSTSHLEFFNDDANKLYASRSSQQESKENSRKNIVDLSFLEKQYNLDSETTSSVKHCKTKMLNNPAYEKGHNENSVFDSSLFLTPRPPCWEETMESVKSYSSHVDRRNSDNLKELNFSEIFAQKRLDSFPFLSTEQNSSNNSNRKAICTTSNESTHRPTCDYTGHLDSIWDEDSQCEQLDIAPRNNKEENEYNQNDTLATDVINKSANMLNTSLNMQKSGEYAKKQEFQSDKIKSNDLFIEREEFSRAQSPKIADEKNHDLEKNQSSTNYIKDEKTLTKPHLIKDDNHVCSTPASPKEDKSNANEDANAKQVSSESCVEIANPFKLSAESNNMLDESKCTETVKDSTLILNKEDEISDSMKDNLDSVISQEIVHQQDSSILSDRKDSEKVVPVIESNISTEINFNQTNGQDDGENSTVCKLNEPITSQNPSDVVSIEQSLNEESDKQQKPENNKQEDEVSPKDQENDEVDHCSTAIISTPAVALKLPAEKNICDLFANEKRKQNISEFTVIKNIINSDEKQHQNPETKENPGVDCNITLDSKLLCIDSSDCGIYSEDRCPLTQISEHDFTEEDSIVPMEWETSQIQEDAVNRLCSIDESSIDFTGAASSLQEANSLLDNLSLSRTSIIKESRVSELIAEIASKPNDEAQVSAVESAPMIEEPKVTPTNNDENKEQDKVSSNSYEKMTYMRATDCNANTKIVPKLVIKKSEASSKFVTKMSPSSVTQLDSTINKPIFKPGCQPKIPKMIIRNARSRPGTPSIEAVHEEAPPVQINISDRTLLTNEELYVNDSEDSLQESSNYRNKIPKMKIKLDEKHSNKIMRTEDKGICVKRKSMKKTVPKVKIKSSKNDLSDDSICSIFSQDSKDSGRYEEKIPVLKLRKQERNRSPSPEVTRKRQSSCHPEVPLKKCKKSGRDETGHSTRRSNSSDSTRTIASDGETRKNPLVRISEKIPKVIIKRTSASAEFKCELSKSCKNVIAKSAKWQPEVKLERYRILDSMVKDLKLTLSPISLRTLDEIFSNRKESGHRREKESDYKLSRSNSTSDLLPMKCKQRRMSDYDCRKVNDTLSFTSSRDTDSKDAKTCTAKKNRGGKSTDEKDKKRRSRSRDDNPRVEIDVTLSDKGIGRSFERSSSEKTTLQSDEHKSDNSNIDHEQVTKADEDTIFASKLEEKNIPVKHSNDSTDFKLALKELKTTSKVESCFVKVPDLNESFSEEVSLRTDKEEKEQDDDDDDDVFLEKDDNNKIVIKTERLSSSGDVDNDCTLQDVSSLKDDPVSMLGNFEMDNNSVIKIESSDESQSTIEILPASPNGTSELESHIIEDGDSEQLYSADAIPTQFELELEITDNSNTDLLDVLMPKLDPITGYSSRRVSTEEPCGDQTLKTTRCNKFETSSRGKNLREKDKHVISSDDRSVLEKNSVGSIKEIFSRSSSDKTVASTVTRENFCCNDSLIKEVLAAKETLKKCLSKSRCENQSNARPKTAAEKKQGSSFDLNSLSETTYSTDVSSQDCHNDVKSQESSIPATSRSNKTENIPNAEKSDKKHSKQSKNSFVKRKTKLLEKNDKPDTKETIDDARECTTISLKAFKRFGETTSNESLIRTIYLSEKRKKNLMEQSDSFQLQDPQRREKNKLASYKIPKISKFTNQESDTNDNMKEIKIKEDNMPILEPEITMNFDASSDRDSSRSPPVITIQDNEDLDITESKLIDDKVIMSSDKIDDTKGVNQKSEMSVADFITQLAYHEKATIKHRRYCNLCERWFPTKSRHRRHLAGYQHRHIELTQRRSIHALFMLFTGKPCPRLLPANVARNDCAVGELTPLQIAVQDVTKSFDCIQQSPKKQNDVDK
ncbi:uncharacterized protein [Anoplolepis gracilipes]|uniref:uncharacterized protein n=1 Tax=Anoplolepis gracilipes TaxID=354296 RepID=UPI003BA1FED5